EQSQQISRRYSITSSARPSNDRGTVRPSALAVFRLMTSSYLVGACTERLAGFSPLRVRATEDAALATDRSDRIHRRPGHHFLNRDGTDRSLAVPAGQPM